jgi:hypothetical protein
MVSAKQTRQVGPRTPASPGQFTVDDASARSDLTWASIHDIPRPLQAAWLVLGEKKKIHRMLLFVYGSIDACNHCMQDLWRGIISGRGTRDRHKQAEDGDTPPK